MKRTIETGVLAIITASANITILLVAILYSFQTNVLGEDHVFIAILIGAFIASVILLATLFLSRSDKKEIMKRFDMQDEKLDSIDKKLDSMDKKLDKLDTMNDTLNEIRDILKKHFTGTSTNYT